MELKKKEWVILYYFSQGVYFSPKGEKDLKMLTFSPNGENVNIQVFFTFW